MHCRDRELDEHKPCQAKFGKDTVHLAWKSSCTVEFLKTVNDLGVTIDIHLSTKDHIQRVCTTAYSGSDEIDPGLDVSGLWLRLWFWPSSPEGSTTATVSWLELTNLK